MARIEEKSKPKLASVIWTWVVAGILTAVVVTGIVLLIIYLVELANDNGEKEFENKYEDKYHITYEQLDTILANISQEEIDTTGTVYVLVYSADFESYTDEDVTVNGETMKFSEFVETIVGKENFYVLNVEHEDNKDYSVQNSDVASISNYPTLLVMDNNSNTAGHFGITVPEALEDEIESGIVTRTNQIINVLLKI